MRGLWNDRVYGIHVASVKTREWGGGKERERENGVSGPRGAFKKKKKDMGYLF